MKILGIINQEYPTDIPTKHKIFTKIVESCAKDIKFSNLYTKNRYVAVKVKVPFLKRKQFKKEIAAIKEATFFIVKEF